MVVIKEVEGVKIEIDHATRRDEKSAINIGAIVGFIAFGSFVFGRPPENTEILIAALVVGAIVGFLVFAATSMICALFLSMEIGYKVSSKYGNRFIPISPSVDLAAMRKAVAELEAEILSKWQQEQILEDLAQQVK